MSLKDFFRPTKWKIIITLVLTAIFEGFVYWMGLHSVFCEMCPPPPAYCLPCVSPETGIIMASITLIPALLIIYLLICLIFLVYRKVRE